MTIAITAIVQWIHIAAGLIWIGSNIYQDYVIWPALLTRPAAEARATYESTAKFAAPLMMIAGMVVMLMGIIRGTFLGPIKSFGYLVTTPYGITWLVALFVMIFITAWGGRFRSGLDAAVWNGDQFHPTAMQTIRSHTLVSNIAFAVILACMVLMRFGL
ncbi:MAG: hypothetical protein IT328_12625 [Caldilineaceae bacterium]|nr:hypothetical protein [Caldilineaceae bacterium]